MEKTIKLRKESVEVYNTQVLAPLTDVRIATAILQGANVRIERGRALPERGEKLLARGAIEAVRSKVEKHVEDTEKTIVLPSKGKAGRIVRSGRLFGVELELIRGGDTIRKHLQCASGFMLKHDGSVNGESLEITTPPLSGTTAEYAFREVLERATSNASTDRSCGLHIHVDARDFKRLAQMDKYEPLRRLVMTYMALQPFMFSIVSPSRRDNSYCKRTECAIHLDNLARIDGEQVYRYVAERIYADDRYQAFNLAPWFRDGHYEYRLHGGTHDTRKILEWANLHTAIADGAMAKAFSIDELRTMMTSPTPRTLDMLAEKLRLSQASVTYWRGRYTLFS